MQYFFRICIFFFSKMPEAQKCYVYCVTPCSLEMWIQGTGITLIPASIHHPKRATAILPPKQMAQLTCTSLLDCRQPQKAENTTTALSQKIYLPLKRLASVEATFSLPLHMAFTACVYSKGRNHAYAKKPFPDCSQRAAMAKYWNAFQETAKWSRHYRQNTKEARKDRYGNYTKFWDNATPYEEAFLKNYNTAKRMPCFMGIRWQYLHIPPGGPCSGSL